MATGVATVGNDGQHTDSISASEDRYRCLFDSASDGILIVNADSGVLIAANPAFGKLLSSPLDILPGTHLWETGIFPDRSSGEAFLRTARQMGYVRLANLTVKTRNGLSRQVEVVASTYSDGNQNCIQCSLRDITDRVAYGSELAAANAQSSIILESMTDGFVVLDREWRFTYFNEQAEQLLERLADDVIGNTAWEMFPESVGTAFEHQYRRAMAEQVVVEFEEYFAPVEMWLEVRAFPSPMSLAIYFTDITVRKKAELALRDSEESLRTSADGAGLGIWQYLVATQEMTFTSSCYEMFGLPADGSVKLSRDFIVSMLHPDDAESTFSTLGKSIREVSDFDVIFRINRPDGKLRWIRSYGQPHLNDAGAIEWIQGLMSDITAQKVAEAERDASDLTNERIVETLQRSLIQILPPNKFPGLDVESLYVPGENEAEIGGDFFDTFAVTDTKVAFVVGDVLGKGLDAVARTTEVKYALRTLIHEYPSPDKALARLNNFLCDTYRLDPGNTGTFVVVALAIVDSAGGKAVFSAAGAEPTLILRRDGSTETVETAAVPLGIQSDSEYAIAELVLAPGETVIMPSDGITGARRGSEFLGNDGLVAIIASIGAETPLEQLAQDAYYGAVEFAGNALRDDVCLLVARLTN